MAGKPKRILIVRTDRIGDVILSTPVISNLRSCFPGAYIAFMCRPYTRPVLEGNPYLDEVIVYDKYGKHKSIWASVKFSFRLRKRKFDWAIILHPTNRVHIVTFLAGIPFRAGWDRKLGFLLTRRFYHGKQEGIKHELDYTLDILRQLHIPIVSRETYFPIRDKEEEKVENLLKGHGIRNEDRLVAIHPSSSCISKRWPQAYFSKMVRLLKDKSDFKIIMISSSADYDSGQQIGEENEVIDLRGKLSLSELGAAIKRAALFISNDSGPVHIAASLGIPVISIFGRSDPGISPLRWRPLGKKSFYFHKNVGCQICLAHNCQKDFSCLKSITPEEVAEEALKICGI